ncbi:MAG: hypothetical protein ACFE9T_05230, partial [Promethearchaeota archaeon]
YTNSSFMGMNYFEQQIYIPTVYIEGGITPIDFLQFLIDYLPNKFDLKSQLDNYLKNMSTKYFKTLSKERQNLILRLNKSTDMFEYYISNNMLDEALSLINTVKKYISSLKNFDTITLIYNFDLEDILIDTMKEIKDEYYLITDNLNQRRIGPNFKSSLTDVPNYSIILINKDLKKSTPQWNLGITKLEALIEECKNVNYKEIEGTFKFNTIISGKDIFINSNYRFLAPLEKKSFNYNSKKIGLIVNSPSIIDKTKKFIEIIN